MFAALALVGTGPAIAARSDPLPPPVFSEEAATAIDAATIAAMEGISQAEAKGVIARQAAIGEVIPRLEAILGSASAGIAVDAPEASTTLNVHVAGKLPKTAVLKVRKVAVALRASGVELELIQGMAHSLEDLTAAAEALEPSRGESGEVLGVGVDVTNNELFAEVTRLGTVADEAATTVSSLARTSSSPPIRVSERLVDSASIEMYGGAPMSTCTTGFSVRDSAGSTGFLTAGHCGESQQYSVTSPFTTWHNANFVAQRWNATSDMQWHKVRASAGEAIGYFYGQNGSTATKRTGNGTAYEGLYLCHRGKVSGYSCGNVGTVNYKPNGDRACGSVACSAAFTTVTSLSLKSELGDSGGPWFMGGTAYGIHGGSAKSGSARTAYFTPIARISGFSGLSVL